MQTLQNNMPIIKPDFGLPKPSTGDKFYKSKKWQRFRKKRMQTQSYIDTVIAIKMNEAGWPGIENYNTNKPMCIECWKEQRIQNGTTYDHIIPRSQGGADYPPPDQMQWLCSSHHQKKRQSERINTNDTRK